MIDVQTIMQSIQFYGTDNQTTVCMEELAELIQAISKKKRGNISSRNLIEEIADVMISVEMLKQIYNISDFEIDMWIRKKQKRQRERMEAGK